MIPLLIIYGLLGVVWLASHGWGVLLLLAWTCYVVDVTFRARIKCLRCKGEGVIHKRGRRLQLCWLCKGRKVHTRLGARLWRRHRYMFRTDPENPPDETKDPTLHDRGWI